MTESGVGPPRWAAALLDRALPPGVAGGSIRADLEDEFRGVAGIQGVGAARRWYAWEAVKLASHYLLRGRRGATGGITNTGGDGMMGGLAQHVRLAARRLRRAPGFALVSVLTMALGIGASVAIFSVVDAVLLEPLPYHGADRLVAIWEWNVPRDRQKNVANPGNFKDWRERTSSFQAMSAVSLAQAVTISDPDNPEEAWGQYAHPDYFRVLGLDAALGRTLEVERDASGAREVVLSHRLWQRRYGGDPGVVGRTVDVSGGTAVVVGVLPPSYVAFGEGTDLWISLDVTRGDQTSSGRWLMVVGRLAEGVTFSAARDELRAVMAGLQDEHPDFNAGWDVNPVPLKDDVVGDVRSALWVLLGAVGLLLVIACANVANLFLVRATERQKEMAVRTSLGAGRATLAGQLFVESTMVAALGAGIGVALAQWGTSLMVTRMPDAFALPRVEGAGVDASVLAFAVGVSVLTGLLFGIVPAVQAGGTSPAAVLGAEGRGASRGTGLVRNGLVVVEVAVSVVLVAGALLFARSFTALLEVDPGLDPERVLVGRVNLSGDPYSEDDGARVAFFHELQERVAALPGVERVGGISFLPLDGSAAGTSFWRGDRPEPEASSRPVTLVFNVTGDYFGAMGVNLLRGRLLGPEDRDDAPRAVVVNQAVADQLFPGEDPLGKPLVVNWDDLEPWEIVGVVEDVRTEGLDVAPRPATYFPRAQLQAFSHQQLVVRASVDPASVAPGIRSILGAMDPGVPLGSVRTMETLVDRAAARPRMTTALMAIFAALATLLASVGLYGVLSYAVSKRERELGVRAALGARASDVVRLVVVQGTRMAALGLVVGVAGALALGGVVSGLLFQVPATDPASLAGAATLLLAVALAACALPAWRASRVPPAEALRSD